MLQIFKILGAGSAEGLSLLGNLLELAAVTATGAYSISQVRLTHTRFEDNFKLSALFLQGFPFSSYGEAVFLSLQTALIALLILFFSGRHSVGVVFAAAYAAIVYAIITPGKHDNGCSMLVLDQNPLQGLFPRSCCGTVRRPTSPWSWSGR